MIESLNTLFAKHLDTLSKEITAYDNEEALWLIDKNITNSGGNLCLHMCGNLQHFIGAVLGKTGYIRDRPAEFGDKNIPRKELLTQIEKTKSVIAKTLNKLDPETLDYEYPLAVFDKPMSKAYFLLHLLSHLTYHLGQVNYHRRLLDV